MADIRRGGRGGKGCENQNVNNTLQTRGFVVLVVVVVVCLKQNFFVFVRVVSVGMMLPVAPRVRMNGSDNLYTADYQTKPS